MSRKTAVVCIFQWNGLRVRDQPLLANLAPSDYLLNLHVIDDLWESKTAKNMRRSSALRRSFYAESVRSLAHNLNQRGSSLSVLKGSTPEAVAASVASLHQTYDVKAVYVEAANTVEEMLCIKDIRARLAEYNVVMVPNAQTLVKPNAIPNSELPDTFTQFRIKVEKYSDTTLRAEFKTPSKLPPPPPDSVSPVASEDVLENFAGSFITTDPRSAFPFPAGENAALHRVHHYLSTTHAIKTYKETRNGLVGSEYSSKLSPFLAFGTLTAITVYKHLRAYEGQHSSNESTYWLFFELLWRDYFQLIAKKYGSRLYQLEGITPNPPNTAAWRFQSHTFDAWRLGKTGIPFVDANMRELAATGFMSNRGRQNAASFLARDLALPWTYGAEWFEEQLLDHDPCSNYGNWQYVAGVGNDPRSDRYFNVIKQGKDYDPEGEYVKLWCPELAKVPIEMIHHPWKMSMEQQRDANVELGITYPLPIVESEAWKKHYGWAAGKGKAGRANQGETVFRRKKGGK
ncbi:DNA photolyase, FAD-binding/Cryptochrome [Chytriomyces sp. MP71]|nr:DNA photolyase, FAD-binding/Cryptochrome [Chytriomyces sp. MP71]